MTPTAKWMVMRRGTRVRWRRDSSPTGWATGKIVGVAYEVKNDFRTYTELKRGADVDRVRPKPRGRKGKA